MYMLQWIIPWYLKKYVSFFFEGFDCILFYLKGKLCQINSKVRRTTKKTNDAQNGWKPLVIIIPLRLGLTDVNAEYIDQLKVFNWI